MLLVSLKCAVSLQPNSQTHEKREFGSRTNFTLKYIEQDREIIVSISAMTKCTPTNKNHIRIKNNLINYQVNLLLFFLTTLLYPPTQNRSQMLVVAKSPKTAQIQSNIQVKAKIASNTIEDRPSSNHNTVQQYR